MSLTSPALIVVLGLLVLGSVALSVWIWPRLAPTRLTTVAGRIGLVGGVNLCVLLLAFAVLNDEFQFFSDWADLLGAAPTVVAADAGASAVTAARATLPPVGASTPSVATLTSRSSFGAEYTVTGGVSGVTSQVLVALPTGYDDPANAGTRYPVLVGVGGYPSSIHQLENTFRVLPTLSRLRRARAIGPVVSVFLQPWTPPGRDTECVDGPGGRAAGDQVETWAAVDVPAWLKASFRVDPSRTGWATWGMSAGGWCAAELAMLHPGTFGAAVSFGGYFRPDWGAWRPFGSRDPALGRYDLVALAASAPPPVAVWVFTSTSDSLGYPSTTALLKAARAPLSVTAEVAVSGGHRLQTWQPWLPEALTWLGRTVTGFAPGR